MLVWRLLNRQADKDKKVAEAFVVILSQNKKKGLTDTEWIVSK